jgi:preprotein translocase subunit SecB
MEASKTKPPPIEMTGHFFSEVELKADAKVFEDVAGQKPIGYQFRQDVRITPPQNEDEDFQVTLTIETEECEGFIKPYHARLQAIGFVKVKEDVKTEERHDIAAILGATLLYSAAREYLYSMTLRGPYPPIYLPTISFIPKDAETPKKPAPPKSRKKKADQKDS